jgi:hypothetical protein
VTSIIPETLEQTNRRLSLIYPTKIASICFLFVPSRNIDHFEKLFSPAQFQFASLPRPSPHQL